MRLVIAMPGLDGLAVARALEGRPTPLAVIFVIAFDQFVVAAFDVAATDYLLKPVTPGLDAIRAHHRVLGAARIRGGPDGRHRHRSHRGRARLHRLHVDAGSFLLHQTISELERRLDPEKFLRLHRSTIVPRDRIAGLRHDGAGNWQAMLRGGRAIRIGRTFLAQARSPSRPRHAAW